MSSFRQFDRRRFLKTVAAPCCLVVAGRGWALPAHRVRSAAFRMVAATDRARILAAAERYLPDPPVTITAFPARLSAGGLHDFFSQADYFWPDPKHPGGPYINRDGESNPANFDAHRRVMIELSLRVPALTAAWLLTGEARYARRAGDHLRAWFVAAETRINPNLLYAQAIIGRSTGRNYGIIDTLHLVEVARAASFLGPEAMRSADLAAVKQWFGAYTNWLTTSERGKQERDTKNNHAMCWAAQAAEFARLANDTTTRADVWQRYREILLPNQEAADGSFPRELVRTKPYSYSIFNFDVMAILCQSLSDFIPEAPRFHLPDGRGLLRAAAFIYPYLLDKNSWRWARDVEHFDALPVRSPGLLFAGLAAGRQEYIKLWKRLNPDPTDREILRNYPVRQPMLWV